jgi:hypothetical protein
VISARRLIAIVCIAVIVITGMTPAGVALLRGILVPLGPLFGSIVSAPLPDITRHALVAAPALSVRASRAPPPA